MYWNIDQKLKKKMLIEFIKGKNGIKYGIGVFCCILLDIIGVTLLVGSIIIFGTAAAIDGMVAGISAGVIFLIIPLIISRAIRRRTIVKLGAPYSEMTKEFLHLEKAGLEFGYHDILNRFDTSMDLYQIYYENIRDIDYDVKCMLLTVTGVGQLTVYDDFYEKRINHNLSQRKFYTDSKYSFILATQDAEKIISEINERIGRDYYD